MALRRSKTTQAARLADWLRGRGLDFVTCRDPGGTALGDRLRRILLDRDSVTISLRSEMLLYMASRAQMVEEIIRPNGVIPHHLPGTNPFLTDYARAHGIPIEAARGGAETMYP